MPVHTDSGASFSGAALRAYDKAKAEGLSDDDAEALATRTEYEHRVRKEGKKT